MNDPLFMFNSVSYSIDGKLILNGISYTFERGKRYALQGDSGAGKSTVLQLLSGFIQPTRGAICYKDITGNIYALKDITCLRSRIMGLVFPDPLLLDELPVVENVMIRARMYGIPYEVAKERALSLLKRVGLLSLAQEKPAYISSGEQQRVAILRALMNEYGVVPECLILDEPTAHVDTPMKKEILILLEELYNQHQVSMIIATHDTEVAQAMDVQIPIAQGTFL